MTSDTIQIQTFSGPAEPSLVRALFTEYASSLGIDLCFQNFEAELAGLPGDYAPPRGALMLARSGHDLLGCMDAARQAGYAFMLLDTLSEMETARAMYQELGFTEVPPYYYNPIEGAHYLMARL